MAKKIRPKQKTDAGEVLTDKELAKLERRISKVYREASEEIQKTMDSFVEQFAAEDDVWREMVKNNKRTQEEYQKWVDEQFREYGFYKDQRASIANTLYNSNQAAANLVNQALPDVFQINANYTAYELEHGAGVNFGFNLYNSNTVKKILAEDARILPSKKIKKSKDIRWNFKNIKNEVAKGIIKGDSVDDIAKRLAKEMPGRNEALLQTHARTMVNSAQNQGRLQRMYEARKMGLNVQKRWMAALDAKTRYTHALLDGVTKELEEPFEIEGYKIMEPGDPTAHPSLVYNCRCRLSTHLVDYPAKFTERRDQETGELIENMTYSDWYKAKTGKSLSAPSKKAKKTESREESNKSEFDKILESLPKDKVTDTDWRMWAEDSEIFQAALNGGKLPKMSNAGAIYSEAYKNRVKETAKKIQELAETTVVEESTLFRGESFDTLEEAMKKYKVGKTITNEKLTSYATLSEVAQGYAEGSFDFMDEGAVKVIITNTNINNKVPGFVGVYTDPLGAGKSAEVVTAKGMKSEVVSTFFDEESSTLYVRMENEATPKKKKKGGKKK